MADQFLERFDKYKILEEVGRGGFADVYRAIDTTLDRTVALKFLEPRRLLEPTFVERFQREAKLAANLKHPNVVIIYEFGWEAGMLYIAMEFLEGQTLKEVLLKEGLLPPGRIVNMVGQIASALDYAHGRGLVHRDIKPSNIMVGADDHVTVMDFGIAKAATLTALTTTGRTFGTPEYMSPEQAEGEKEPDARSDVYSLGVVIYEMFTGKVPFSGTAPLSIMRGHTEKSPPLPSEINPDVSPAVEAVLLKALAKKGEERYQSAGAMAAALKRAVSGAVTESSEALDKGQREGIVCFVPPTKIAPFLDQQLKNEGLHIENSRNRVPSSLDINDVLVLTYHIGRYIDLTESEIDDILSFVRRGGSLILAGHAWAWKQYESGTEQTFPLNRIAQRFGVTFIMGGANEISEIMSHQITEGVSRLPVDGRKFQPGFLAIQEEEVVDFLRDRHKRVVAACLVYGNGKVILFTHGGLFSEDALNLGDYRQLALNMFRWHRETLHLTRKAGIGETLTKGLKALTQMCKSASLWFLLGLILTGIAVISFKQQFRCWIKYQVTEAIVILIGALIGFAAVELARIIPPYVQRIVRIVLGGVSLALAISIAIVLFLPSPAEEVCPPGPTLTSTSAATEMPVVITKPSMSTPAHAATSMPIGEVLIKIDDTVIDLGGGRCREIVRNSRHRIEVTVLDSEGTTLQPEVFSYRWHFNPPDKYNQEKLEEDFKGNAISYYVSSKLNSQTVTVEVLREEKMVAVRSICFNIKKQL